MTSLCHWAYQLFALRKAFVSVCWKIRAPDSFPLLMIFFWLNFEFIYFLFLFDPEVLLVIIQGGGTAFLLFICKSWYTPVMRIVGSWDGWKLWGVFSGPFWSLPRPPHLLLSLSKMGHVRMRETLKFFRHAIVLFQVCNYLYVYYTANQNTWSLSWIFLRLKIAADKTSKKSLTMAKCIKWWQQVWYIRGLTLWTLSSNRRMTADTWHETWVEVREAVKSVHLIV